MSILLSAYMYKLMAKNGASADKRIKPDAKRSRWMDGKAIEEAQAAVIMNKMASAQIDEHYVEDPGENAKQQIQMFTDYIALQALGLSPAAQCSSVQASIFALQSEFLGMCNGVLNLRAASLEADQERLKTYLRTNIYTRLHSDQRCRVFPKVQLCSISVTLNADAKAFVSAVEEILIAKRGEELLGNLGGHVYQIAFDVGRSAEFLQLLTSLHTSRELQSAAFRQGEKRVPQIVRFIYGSDSNERPDLGRALVLTVQHHINTVYARQTTSTEDAKAPRAVEKVSAAEYVSSLEKELGEFFTTFEMLYNRLQNILQQFNVQLEDPDVREKAAKLNQQTQAFLEIVAKNRTARIAAEEEKAKNSARAEKLEKQLQLAQADLAQLRFEHSALTSRTSVPVISASSASQLSHSASAPPTLTPSDGTNGSFAVVTVTSLTQAALGSDVHKA